ncbi:molybdate ABC transporter permease subunit [Macrococcus equipercicus]|uniref:Molybdenum transport system permease n=1 Tax=Macrococcus equipercicus TaxID=69967 RepID=A0ABQ6R907_9STAP|nr:molybdate ABC transporter permease subunit [Macrococcus equipercicus]KAA1039616.1 molybdate ABC transporter permease subunit [Macrococcus equipercicus]
MDLLFSEEFFSPIVISLKVACTATLLSFLIGIMLAFTLSKQTFPGKSFVETVIMLPMVLPPTVVGFLLLYLFGRYGILGQWIYSLFNTTMLFSIYAAIIASTVVAVPLMYQSLKIGIDNVSSDVLEAAQLDGANSIVIFKSIIMPLSKNALLTGILFAFARALGEFGATLIFAGNIPGITQTLPTAIYVAIENNELLLAGIWVAMMVLLSFVLMLIIQMIRKDAQ